MLKKHLARTPFVLLFVALVSLLVITVFTSAAGHAQTTEPSDGSTSEESVSPTSSATPTDPSTSAEPTPEPSASASSTNPDKPDNNPDLLVELYDTEGNRLENAAVSADQELIVSATVKDSELTQLLKKADNLDDQTAFELELELPNEEIETVTYHLDDLTPVRDDLKPRSDENGRPLADTYWIDPANVDSDLWIESLPEDANGVMMLTATYGRNGALEEPVTSEEEVAFLDTAAPIIEELAYGSPEESGHDVDLGDYLVADGQRYPEVTVVDEPTADNRVLTPETVENLQEQFVDLWNVAEVTATHNGDKLEVTTVTSGETYRILLDESIEYSLDELNIEVADTVDNSETYNAQERNAELNKTSGMLPSTIAIDSTDGDWYTRMIVDDGAQEQSGQALIINNKASNFVLESNKPFFPRLLEHVAGDELGLNFEQSYGDHRVGVSMTCTGDPKAEDGEPYRIECLTPDDEILEGTYRPSETPVDNHENVQWSLSTGYIEVLNFTLDTTAPEVAVTNQPQGNGHDVIEELSQEDTDFEPYQHRSLLLGESGKSITYELAL